MKKLLGISLALCLALTGCGSSNETASETAAYDSYDEAYSTNKSAGLNYQSNGDYEDYAEEAEGDYSYDEAVEDESYTDYADAGTSSDNALTDAENKKTSAGSKGAINTEMLVYTCNVAIRTEKFDQSYDMLKNLISDMEGFIESENYSESDSSYSSSKVAHFTVRIPSNNYNTFLDSFGDIGTVVNKSSNAENVSQEYSDTEKALEIYEAELARYIERIKTIKDESTLMELEGKITELQIKVAQLKSRRSQIETDVAYSYVYITLSESIYKEETEESFGGRFLNTINRSWHSFLDMCEGLLFFLILVLPEVIVIFIIVLVIIKLIKRSKRKKAEKKAKKEAKAAETNDLAETDVNIGSPSVETDNNIGNTIDKNI
ncbi:MAG: DUF4349 domain-containing protein [Lachnospiraceae bacterium]|nr:DUF4349 domain-containing protein [Lachnospiraceae bacterium]